MQLAFSITDLLKSKFMLSMYTVDINSDEPIMLINKHIGFDGEDGMGIDGSLFQQELLQLDSMGKKRIQVWINSPGGVVLDGYNIFNAILKSNTPVDTYNVGIAASIAGVIFMAGRKRIMADYSSLMIHPPHGGDDRKQMDAIGGSLTTMLAAKSNCSEVDVKYLMDRTTWLNAAECFAKGFCTDIEITADSNKKRMPLTTNVMEMWKVANSINNFKNNNSNSMTKITMKLGLNDAATEDNVITAIKGIEDKAYAADVAKIDAENKLTAVENAAKKTKADYEEEMDKMKKEMDSKKSAFDKLTCEYNAMVEDKVVAENAAKKVQAENMVDGFAKAGRIKNEAGIKLKWVNKAIENFEDTKSMIEDLPLSKEAITVVVENKLGDGELSTSAMALAVKNKLRREGKIK